MPAFRGQLLGKLLRFVFKCVFRFLLSIHRIQPISALPTTLDFENHRFSRFEIGIETELGERSKPFVIPGIMMAIKDPRITWQTMNKT